MSTVLPPSVPQAHSEATPPPAPETPAPPHASHLDPHAGSISPSHPMESRDTATLIQAEVQKQHTLLCTRIDETFAWLMLAQWIAASGIAVWISPLTWAGDTSRMHPHLTFALLYGGALTLGPVLLTRLAPGERATRLTIAATQMLMSALLVHLTGGRIETHFHIFGSLAFLACYLDWEVLMTASMVVLLDHMMRGLYLPFSAFGSHLVQPWRWLEHVGWVVFCDIFLVIAGQARMRGIREAATRLIERSQLLHRAHFDPLTDLPNRNFLSEKIAELILECARTSSLTPAPTSAAIRPAFGCLYVDLDRFKDVNDRLGHASGDAVLRMAAQRMQTALGPDAFLARVGGDEFIALILEPNFELSHPSPIEAAARNILATIAQPFVLPQESVTLGASIGISHYPAHGQDEAELLLSSDRAMYTVKRAGRNDYLTYNTDLQSCTTESEEADLHFAILHNQLEPFFQPIFHSGGPYAGRIASLELLLRWRHPLRGYIPPGNFIPLAEQTGLIVQLGNFVLKAAAMHATRWRRLGLLPGRIAVNVSSLELAREDFADVVIKTLQDHQTPGSIIEIEVTETALVNNFSLAERHLHTLRAYGIRVAIDDFGTGYSSLSRLRQLTLDSLKIDRSFIEGVMSSEADRTVIEHIIAMAHTLGMQVIAEGVETEAQLDVLRTLGCDLIQGFLLGRPINEAQTELLLSEHQAARNPLHVTQ